MAQVGVDTYKSRSIETFSYLTPAPQPPPDDLTPRHLQQTTQISRYENLCSLYLLYTFSIEPTTFSKMYLLTDFYHEHLLSYSMMGFQALQQLDGYGTQDACR